MAGLVAVLAGGHAHGLGEEAGEVEAVLETKFEADLVDFHVGMGKEMTGVFDLELVEVTEGAHAGSPLE